MTADTLIIMFLWRNKRVAINFAGMLLVACKQRVLLFKMLKSWLSSGDIEMKTLLKKL